MAYLRDKSFIIKFGNRVKELRQAKNLTQLDVATEIGLDVSHIGRIERGTQNTSISHLAAIARALDVPPAELLNFK